MAILDEFLSKQDAAVELGVSTRTLDRWWSERIGPPRARVGRAVFYKRDSIRDWINKNEVQPVREAMARSRDTRRAVA